MKVSPEEILKKYWGFDTFRPYQKQIITSILEENDTLALLPTGGGKSLCFQLPAMAKEGIAIVVSPLLSLMKDQVMQLNQRGIKSLYLPGGIPYNELSNLLDNCQYGNYKLLYLSPERLQQELVLERLKNLPISLMAVDEAHCISQWGHDFRPAYRAIAQFRESLPHVSCIALTATATPQVIEDIAEQLQFEDANIFQSSFERKNLFYTVHKGEDKQYRLLRLLKERDGSAIVYVRSRKSAQKYAAYLNSNGIKSHYYHGGEPIADRNAKFLEWLQNKVQVMVATSAFGMGIDKPDVRTVVHMELPESLESYFQEAGRAGRDGQEALSTILNAPDDKNRLENQFVKVLPSLDMLLHVYKKLNAYFKISYGEGEMQPLDFNFMEFCQAYELNTMVTFNSLQLLDRNSVLSFEPRFKRDAMLTFIVSPVQLTVNLIKNPKIDRIVKTILRTYGGIFDQKLNIDLSLIARKANSTVKQVHEALLQLEKDSVAAYEYKSFDTSITFLVPREDERAINRIAKNVKAQQNRKIEQVKAMLSYVSDDMTCRSIQLLSYFGETQSQRCGQCDVCQNQTARTIGTEGAVDLASQILILLDKGDRSSRELSEALPNVREQHVVDLLKKLLEQRKVLLTSRNQYSLVK